VVVHEFDVPDVRAIRSGTGMSQAEFARSIGVKKATLVNWEQARRKPEGPARVLLALIAKEPGIVGRVLGGQ
jgi:putative transcriptional regulator